MNKNDPRIQEELELCDQRIAELEEYIAMAEALERLHENEDFKKVILEGYFEKEAKRLFGLLVDAQPIKRESMENIIEMLNSIRHLKQFHRNIILNNAIAKENLEYEKEYRKKVKAGEVDLDGETEAIGGGA
jgi:hypothetical protein